MATGGCETCDLPDGQEEVYDWTCHPCEDNGKVSKAVVFCQDCKEGYCNPCLKTHNRFPAMKKHAVFDENQMNKWEEGQVDPGSELQCDEHSGQKLSMYCKEHDVVCCPICVAIDHRLCGGMAYIPNMATDIKQSDQFRKTQRGVSSAISEVDTAIGRREKTLKVLDASLRDAFGVIEHEVGELHKLLKVLENKAKSSIDKVHQDIKQKQTSELDKCRIVHNELEMVKQKLDLGDNASEASTFVSMKMAEKKVAGVKIVMQSLSMSMDARQVNMKADSVLHTIREMRAVTNSDRLYKLQQEYDCNIRSAQDKTRVVICGMLQLPNGNIILSDQLNCALKQLDTSYKMTHRCALPGRPSQICYPGQPDSSEVVVALLDGYLQYVCVEKRIKLTKSIRMQHKCNGLVFHNDKFYISDGSNRVYIYTKECQLLMEVGTDDNGEDILSCSQDLSLRLEHNTAAILIADREKGAVVVIDLEGEYISTIHHALMSYCFRVCMDGNGNMFTLQSGILEQFIHNGSMAIGCVSHKVQQFLVDEQKKKLFVITEDGRLKIFTQ